MGGGSSHKVDIDAADIVLDLHDKYRSWKGPPGWESMAIANQPVIVDMYITDMSAPYWIGRKFWLALWNDLKAEAVSRGGSVKVLATCYGGHGRTGTVLTALALAANAVPKKADPIIWMRANYCDHAIESNTQLAYLEQLFDFKTLATAYKTPAAATGNATYAKSGPSAGILKGSAPAQDLMDMYDIIGAL